MLSNPIKLTTFLMLVVCPDRVTVLCLSNCCLSKTARRV